MCSHFYVQLGRRSLCAPSLLSWWKSSASPPAGGGTQEELGCTAGTLCSQSFLKHTAPTFTSASSFPLPPPLCSQHCTHSPSPDSHQDERRSRRCIERKREGKRERVCLCVRTCGCVCVCVSAWADSCSNGAPCVTVPTAAASLSTEETF